MKHYKKTPYFKAWILALNIFAIPWWFFLFVLSSNFAQIYTYIGIGILLLSFFLTAPISSYYFEIGIGKLYSLKIYDNYFLNTKMKINEEGINIITELSDIFFNWSALNNLYIIKNNIYIDTFMREFIFIGNNDIEENTRVKLLEMITTYTELRPIYKFPIIIYA
ncbi:MAG: hypothetical protein ACOWWH_08985 [Eubacteriaceae bacterium]